MYCSWVLATQNASVDKFQCMFILSFGCVCSAQCIPFCVFPFIHKCFLISQVINQVIARYRYLQKAFEDEIKKVSFHLTVCVLNWGYYMAAWRYKISLRVWKNVAWVSAANEWKNFQHEKRNFMSASVQRFLKILQNFSEGQTNISEHCPKIDEDLQRRSKVEIWKVPNRNRTHDLPNTGWALYQLSYKNSWRGRSFNWVVMWQWCFDHTLANLSAVKWTKMLLKMISSCVWIKMISSDVHVGILFL